MASSENLDSNGCYIGALPKQFIDAYQSAFKEKGDSLQSGEILKNSTTGEKGDKAPPGKVYSTVKFTYVHDGKTLSTTNEVILPIPPKDSSDRSSDSAWVDDMFKDLQQPLGDLGNFVMIQAITKLSLESINSLVDVYIKIKSIPSTPETPTEDPDHVDIDPTKAENTVVDPPAEEAGSSVAKEAEEIGEDVVEDII